MNTSEPDEIREAVRERYAKAARGASSSSCCGPSGSGSDLFGGSLYESSDIEALPADAVTASLGCGNPTMLADLQAGDVVLDLGSGGGIDVLLSARRVGPTGKAYGLDMTPEMLELARKNQLEAGLTNVEFLQGTIEDVPLPDASVDVVISNCVVNLSPDKDAVVREVFRVLRPGGRVAISDVVLRRPLPGSMRDLIGLWTGCVAGALVVDEYDAKLRAAGFEDVSIEPTQVYDEREILSFAADLTGDVSVPPGQELDTVVGELAGSAMSAFVRARKPH